MRASTAKRSSGQAFRLTVGTKLPACTTFAPVVGFALKLFPNYLCWTGHWHVMVIEELIKGTDRA